MQTQSWSQVLVSGLTSGALAAVVNLSVAAICAWLTKAPPSFAPFTPPPVIAGSVGGALLASLTYFLLQSLTANGGRLFPPVAALALLASFYLPWRLSFSQSPRFMGATLAMQISLGLMHTVVAGLSVVTLLGPHGGSRSS